MAVDAADLRELVNTSSDDDGVLQQCLNLGEALVAKYTASVTVGLIPEVVRDEAVLVAAADQFNRRKAPNGVLNGVYDTSDGVPSVVRISRDPFVSIKPLLAPWVGGGNGLRTVSLLGGYDE